jgi:hypothetical protein
MFFDRKKVTDAMDRKSKKCLSSAGAFGRTFMKRGMRKRKGVSAVGAFPSSHSGELRDLIYFVYDAASKGVVIGPKLFKKGRDTTGSKTIPQLVNEGGAVSRVAAVGRGGNSKRKRVKQVYKPRPFVALTQPVAAAKLVENMAKFDFK